MKRLRLLFPLMFLLAFVASAFTQNGVSSKKRVMTAYYQDPYSGDCNVTALSDGQCITDPVGPQCTANVYPYFNLPMWQYGIVPGICYVPFYQYN